MQQESRLLVFIILRVILQPINIENQDLEPPFMCLIVSGGHTHLVVVEDYDKFNIIGRTRDDAAGGSFR